MIKGPKNATPTPRGWVNPKSGELLKSQKLTEAQIAEWHGVEVVEAVESDWVGEDVDHDGTVDELESMTKSELEELGRTHGVELDRRKSRASLINKMKSIIYIDL